MGLSRESAHLESLLARLVSALGRRRRHARGEGAAPELTNEATAARLLGDVGETEVSMKQTITESGGLYWLQHSPPKSLVRIAIGAHRSLTERARDVAASICSLFVRRVR